MSSTLENKVDISISDESVVKLQKLSERYKVDYSYVENIFKNY